MGLWGGCSWHDPHPGGWQRAGYGRYMEDPEKTGKGRGRGEERVRKHLVLRMETQLEPNHHKALPARLSGVDSASGLRGTMGGLQGKEPHG